MTTMMPNPFQSAEATPPSADSAPAPRSRPHSARGGPVSPAEDQDVDEHRFVLDEAAFMNDIEPLPAFLSAPSQNYLREQDLISVMETLAGRG